jgi:hypothetical protein
MNNSSFKQYFYVVSTIGIIVSRHGALANAKRAQARLGKAAFWVIALDHKAGRGRLVVVSPAGVATTAVPEGGVSEEQGEWLWENAGKGNGLLYGSMSATDRALAALSGHERAGAAQMKAIYSLAGAWV